MQVDRVPEKGTVCFIEENEVKKFGIAGHMLPAELLWSLISELWACVWSASLLLVCSAPFLIFLFCFLQSTIWSYYSSVQPFLNFNANGTRGSMVDLFKKDQSEKGEGKMSKSDSCRQADI